MPTARDVMTAGIQMLGIQETVATAAARMATLDVGALPICGEDGSVFGMLTDRDIVLRVVARGLDPTQVRVGELAQGVVVTVDADDDLTRVVEKMSGCRVRRLPVVDGRRLVGMVSQADLARALPDAQVAAMLREVSTPSGLPHGVEAMLAPYMYDPGLARAPV